MMEGNQQDEIDKLKRLLADLETKNSQMNLELRDLNVRLNHLIQTQQIQVQNEKITPPLIPVEDLKVDPQPPVMPTVPEEKMVSEEYKPTPTPSILQQASALASNEVKASQADPVQQNTVKLQPNKLQAQKVSKSKQDWERFIGENLINKIGILITIIGVAIGTKYAIDKELLTPAMRIALGYALGTGLLLFAIKLKEKYLDFSAVLLSGSTTIFYFLTYISYSFYHFFPVQLTFAMMVIFTAFTVFASLKYNRQIIAHFGLIGAYAVPFLLSDGSGKVGFFFSYISMVNIGILIISFMRNWKSLQYVSYGLTWTIFISWFVMAYNPAIHFKLALGFLLIFFIIFYAIGLVYKLVKHEKFDINDILFILGNSFLFFGFAYYAIHSHGKLDNYLGMFCVFNAIIHFVVSVILYRNKSADRVVFYLTSGLVLLFITIAIPVQFEGNVITLTWSMEALMLFLLGRLKKVSMFELMSYPVFIVAFISLGLFWIQNYVDVTSSFDHVYSFYGTKEYDIAQLAKIKNNTFLFNMDFFSSCCVIAGLAIVFYFNSLKNKLEDYKINLSLPNTFKVISVILLLCSIFIGVFLEINRYWEIKIFLHQLTLSELKTPTPNFDIALFKIFANLSRILFPLIFFGALLFVRRKKENASEFNVIFCILGSMSVALFLSLGLYQVKLMQLIYTWSDTNLYPASSLILIRVLSYGALAFFMFSFLKFGKQHLKPGFTESVSKLILYFVILVCLTLELNLYWEIKEIGFKALCLKEIHRIDAYNLALMETFALISKIALFLVFFGFILFRHAKKENSQEFNFIIFLASTLIIAVFLVFGLYHFSYLQLNFLHSKNEYYAAYSLVLIRYLMYGLFAVFTMNYFRFLKKQYDSKFFRSFAEFILHIALVWIVSAELVNWMHVFNSKQVYKLALSILWGVYSLGLISYGIWKKNSPLRIGAISLFGVTLIKLFLYDLQHMSTISKTVVFIALGILLLIISFLYNKYKSVLFEDNEK